jgi:glycine/D-amino acid oxidase-like deaminating enzyme
MAIPPPAKSLKPMAPIPERVESDAEIPERVDVAVIGGGIIGASTAYFLAERGLSVALIEKHEIACEQSSRNWGWCRQMGRDPKEIPLIIESLALWRTLNVRLGEETGFRQSGIVYLAETENELAVREGWLPYARQYQLDCRLIRGRDVEAIVPGSTRSFLGALHTPSDGRAEPTLAAPALARATRRLGGRVLTRCAVRTIETEGGRVSHVVTERGPVKCSSAVLAAGAWSRLFAGNLGIDLPQLKVVNSVMRTAPLDTPLEQNASGGKFAFRKRLDGGYTIAHKRLAVADVVPDSFRLLLKFLPVLMVSAGSIRLRAGRRFVEEARMKRRWKGDERTPFEEVRVLDPEPVGSILREALASAQAYFPVFRNAEIVERWAGMIDATPDAVPIISGVAERPGLYVSTGYSGHGFGIGPGAGRLMADLITGQEPLVDPGPFRFERFSDGTRMEPIAGF